MVKWVWFGADEVGVDSFPVIH